MRNIPISGVNVPILEGGDHTDFAPWMESYTNALKAAITASAATGIRTVAGHVHARIPAKAYGANDVLAYGVSGAMWPNMTASSPNTVANLMYPLTKWWNFGFSLPTSGACWFYLTPLKAFTQSSATIGGVPSNQLRFTYHARDRVGPVHGYSALPPPVDPVDGMTLPDGGHLTLITGAGGSVDVIES